MAASFPTFVKNFGSAVVDGVDDVLAAHVNDLRLEVAAIETQLLTSGTWVVAWTASGTAPSLGNGTLTGSYTVVGKLITAQINFLAGSTTTFGTGTWRFSLPVAAAIRGIGMAQAWDSSAGTEHGGLTFVTSSTLVYALNGTSYLDPSVPFTWAQSDAFSMTITYQIA